MVSDLSYLKTLARLLTLMQADPLRIFLGNLYVGILICGPSRPKQIMHRQVCDFDKSAGMRTA